MLLFWVSQHCRYAYACMLMLVLWVSQHYCYAYACAYDLVKNRFYSLLLTVRPWAECGSWFTRVFFFLNCAAMGRARFMVYPWFFFFRSFVCDQTQASTRPNFESRNLWCLLPKSCWNINKSDLRYWLSREKIKNPAFVKNYIFSAEI